MASVMCWPTNHLGHSGLTVTIVLKSTDPEAVGVPSYPLPHAGTVTVPLFASQLEAYTKQPPSTSRMAGPLWVLVPSTGVTDIELMVVPVTEIDANVPSLGRLVDGPFK